MPFLPFSETGVDFRVLVVPFTDFLLKWFFLNPSCLCPALHYLPLTPLFCSNTVHLPDPWCFASSCHGLLPSFPFLFFICSLTVWPGIQCDALFHVYHIRGLYSDSSHVPLSGGGSPTPILGFGSCWPLLSTGISAFILTASILPLVGPIFHLK